MFDDSTSQTLAEVTQLPSTLVERRIVQQAFNAIRAGGNTALRQFLQHGHTLSRMDEFAKRQAFQMALSEPEKQRLASYNLNEQVGYIHRVVIENDAEGHVLIVAETDSGRHPIGQSVTVAGAQWAVASRLSSTVPVSNIAQDVYLVHFPKDGASLTWSTLASSPAEAKSALRQHLGLADSDPLAISARPIWNGVCDLLNNCLPATDGTVRLASNALPEGWLIQVESNEGSIAGTYRLDDTRVELFLTLTRFGFQLAGMDVVLDWNEAVAA